MVSSELKKYRNLIQNMPVRELACFSKRSIWEEFAKRDRTLQKILDRFSVDNKLIVISRQDLFDLARRGVSAQFVYATIIWGYPRGVRGGRFSKIISNINTIVRKLQGLPNNITEADWITSYQNLQKVDGLAISSWTKFLYFLGFHISGSSALILDGQLIKVFRKRVFPDFQSLQKLRFDNSPKRYPLYLRIMSDIAKELNVDADKLEIFLFNFGKLLKIPTAAGL